VSDATLKPVRFRTLIRVYDLERSLEFYRDKLGLKVLSSWDRPEGAGHIVEAGGSVIVLLGKTPGDASRGGWDFIMPVAKYELVLEVPSVQKAYDALKAKGVEPVGPPEPTSWGAIWFTVLDPDETPVVYLEEKPKA
jgi:catechol 2,3-dioxygenase-like lactoylglutathione lyase family enzyme